MKENNKNVTPPKIKINKQVFLGQFKIEDYLQKEVERLLEKYKK